VKETKKELKEEHYLQMISNNVFGGVVHELTIFENNKPHINHKPKEEIDKEFASRKKGLSKFSIMLIEKLELYIKKHTERIDILKTFLGDD